MEAGEQVAMSSRVLCIPPEVECVTVYRRTRRELHTMARARIAFIDHVAYARTRGLRVDDHFECRRGRRRSPTSDLPRVISGALPVIEQKEAQA